VDVDPSMLRTGYEWDWFTYLRELTVKSCILPFTDDRNFSPPALYDPGVFAVRAGENLVLRHKWQSAGKECPGKLGDPGKKREHGCCPGQGIFLGTGMKKKYRFGSEKEKWFNYVLGGGEGRW
jgi:hypothetical protein